MSANSHRSTRSSGRARRLAIERLEPRQLLTLAPEGLDHTFVLWENQPYTMLATDFVRYGLGSASADIPAVKIDAPPEAGLLTLDDLPVAAGQLVQIADIAAGKLKFVAASGGAGSPDARLAYQLENADLVLDPTPNTLTFDVLAGPPGRGTNPTNRLDVNADGIVDIHDELWVMNFINVRGNETPAPDVSDPYFDVNDDGLLSYADLALIDEYLFPGNEPPSAFPKPVSAYPNTGYALRTDDFGFLDMFDVPPNATAIASYFVAKLRRRRSRTSVERQAR